VATPTLVTVNCDIAPDLRVKEVIFDIPVIVRYNAGPDVIVRHSTTVEVPTNGVFTTQLYGTNDPNWSPANWNYKVTFVGDNYLDSFYIQVPYDQSPVNLSALLPALTPSQGQAYAPIAHGNHVLVLSSGDPVPPETPPNTVILRLT
jgi:hypothetical protein